MVGMQRRGGLGTSVGGRRSLMMSNALFLAILSVASFATISDVRADTRPVHLEAAPDAPAPAPPKGAKPAPAAKPGSDLGNTGAAPSTPAQLFGGLGTIGRTISLEDLGFKTPLVFEGAGMERELFFRVPRGVHLADARLQVDGNYLRSSGGRLTLVTTIDGTPVAARDFDAGEGPVDLTVPAKVSPIDADFVRVGFKFASIAFADWCQDNRSIGNVVNIFPSTRLIYRLDPREISSVRAAWVLLPHKTTILIPTEQLSPVQYDAALKMALAVRATGREVKFGLLPALGSTVSVADLEIPAALHSLPIFRKFSDTPDAVQLTDAADRGAYEVVLALSGHSVGDIVLGDSWFRSAVNDDMVALRGELQKEGPDTAAAFGHWLDRAMPATEASDPDTNLKLAVALGQPVIMIDTDRAGIGAELMADRWYNLARTMALNVHEADVDSTAVDWITLDHLNGSLGPQDIVDHGDWVLTFNAGLLPPGRWPSAVEVDMRVAPDSSNADPVYLISLNDTLLRADKVTEEGGIARATAEIPPYLLAANNKLTIGVQRGPLAQDCRYLPHGYTAQVLPTSRLLLSDLDLHEQFFGLWPAFSQTGVVGVPNAYLASSVDSLQFVQTFLAALAFRPTSLQLYVIKDAPSFQPKGVFAVFDSPITATDSGAKLSKAGLVLPDSGTAKKVDISGVGAIALAQMATSNGQQGVLVTSADEHKLPKIKLASLDDGQVVVADSRGVVVQAGKSWRQNAAIGQAVNAPSEYGYRYRVWLIAGIIIILLLVFMSVVRAFVNRRRRRV